LLHSPKITTLQGLRDTAMIALALCTGIREAELVNLQVDDIRQRFGGEVSLHVRKGKGNKTRIIPYGELIWCLKFVDAWLDESNIRSGALFRRVYWFASEQRHKVPYYATKLVPTSFYDILERNPVQIEGESVFIRPHDLRRTYALRCYEAGMDMVRIQRNLGHVNHTTTLHYIGSLDGEMRRPPAAYQVPDDLILGLNKES
jgi:integrase/recombinase XerC